MKFLFRLLVTAFCLASLLTSLFAQPVQAQISAPPQINKQFTPISIVPGEIARLTITIYNPNTFQLTNAQWTDNLEGVQPGITLANPVNMTNSCGGTVSAPAGGKVISLTGGTVPAQVGSTPGSCTVAVNVTSLTSGNLINTIPEGGMTAQGGGFDLYNTTPASATLNVEVVPPPSLNKNFNLNTVWVGQSSQLTINIVNNDSNTALTQVSLTDNLPTNVVLASPVSPSLTGCGSATLTANSNDAFLTLNNATIAGGGTCTIKVNVKSNTAGVYTNTIPAGAIQCAQGVTNASNASANLNVQAVSISKAFSPTTIQAGEISTLTITFRNPTDTPYTGVSLTDVLPGTVLQVVDGSASTTCTSGSEQFTITLPNTVTLSGGLIPPGTISTPGQCTLQFNVTTPIGAGNATHTNTIDANTMVTDQGVTNVLSTSAALTVQALSIGVVKAFNPARFEAGGTSLLTITLQNRTSNDFTDVQFTDLLPAPLELDLTYTPVNTCGGTVDITNTPEPSVSLAGGTIPSGSVAVPGTCTVTVRVTAPADTETQTITNTIPINAVTSGQGVSNLTQASGSVIIYTAGQGMTGSKSFSPASIAAGGNSTLTIDIYAPDDSALTALNLTDTLPAGMVISATPGASRSGCTTGTLTTTAGSNVITLANSSLTAGTRCRIRVNVTSNASAVYTNTISPADITSTDKNGNNQTLPAAISANLTVSDFTISKAFYPDTVAPNGLSTLTITLQNTNTSPLTNVSLTDNLTTMGGTAPTQGVYVASAPNYYAISTCGGTLTAAADSRTISLTGATIPAKVGAVPGICTITVNVVGKGSAATRTNTLYRADVSAIIQSSGNPIQPVADATAVLNITSLVIGVVKGFDPITVFGGSSSTVSIQFVNSQNSVLTGISLTDMLPAGMYIANPPNLSTGTCGGTLTGEPGASILTFSGGVLSPFRRCTITASVTMNVNGNLTNSIAAGDVTTFNGATNPQPTEATLTNLPGASVSKYFDPPSLLAEPGNYSLLTITINNTGNVPLTGMGLIDTLPGTLPDGLYIAGAPEVPLAPAPANTCGGTLTAVTGTQSILLSDGSLPGLTSCTIQVAVTTTQPGTYRNLIPEGSIETEEDATNIDPAEATVRFTAAPQMQIVKNILGSAPFDQGETVEYEIIVTNTGDITLTNVTVTDPGTNVTLGACTPAQPATLAAAQSMTCSATHVISEDDVTAGSFSNTAYADSDQTDPVNDSAVIPINTTPAMSIKKLVTSSGPYNLNDTITYQITVKNIGGVNLSNVRVTEAGVGAVLGVCTPDQGSTLNPGESMLCSATHVVTQTDIEAGIYSNTATADSEETPSMNDSVSVPINQNPALQVFKQVVSNPPYDLGSTITYDISVLNSGNITLTGVRVTDAGVGAALGTCTPAMPATLAPGAFMSCSATHVVTQSDIDAGKYTNTATGDSDQTDPASATRNVSFTQIPSIELQKTGTLHMDVIQPSTSAEAGDTITYTFTVTNTGNVTLSNITITDPKVTISGGPITLAPGASDSSTFTGTYTLTQADIDAGTFTNTATVSGSPQVGQPVTDSDDDTQVINPKPLLGIAKRVIGETQEVSPGTWEVTYEILLKNYGNVTLSNLQVTDNLAQTFQNADSFEVQEVSSSDFAVNFPAFNGDSETRLLQENNPQNELQPGESGTLILRVHVVPTTPGPYNNSAIASGDPPEGSPVTDTSQDGADPDPGSPSDGDPTNNNQPTPVSFGPQLFDPPLGIKAENDLGEQRLAWSMVWINHSNILAINVEVSDGIPFGTAFVDNGIPSGYDLPPGELPSGSTATGVTCTDTSSITQTTYCYYEGPTTAYPRGRIVWVGTLGPDLNVTNPALAVNDITINFTLRLLDGTTLVQNMATVDVDTDGNGEISESERFLASASETYQRTVSRLPQTGFTPGLVTLLPEQPDALDYALYGDLWLDIPSLGVQASIVGVPQYGDTWDVTWLGSDVGYLQGSAFPTWTGNSVLTGHVWDANNNPGIFSRIRQLHYGAQFKIHAYGWIYTYEVRENRLLRPDDLSTVMQHFEDRSWVTLLTCEDYSLLGGTYSYRRMVRAVLVSITEEH